MGWLLKFDDMGWLLKLVDCGARREVQHNILISVEPKKAMMSLTQSDFPFDLDSN